jgi:predicted dehydrogenase
MNQIRWGMIGCGDVAEAKSGPAFQKADGSALVAVMRRDRGKADDFARRHGVPRAYGDADALINDSEVDAVYIATPPSSHGQLALEVAAAGKPCLVEKPMATNHEECLRMIDAFRSAGRPLWVAYYRRALPRFLKVRELLREGAIGRVTSVHVYVSDPLAVGEGAQAWRFNPEIAGAGLFLDLASHYFDIIDFLVGRITAVAGFAMNTGGSYAAEDVTAAAFQIGANLVGTGIWNFNAPESVDSITFTGSEGQLTTAVRADADVSVIRGEQRAPRAAAARGTERTEQNTYRFRNPPHVHQPLIQTIVDELRGRGRCESTGESGARASWVMERCLEQYRRQH